MADLSTCRMPTSYADLQGICKRIGFNAVVPSNDFGTALVEDVLLLKDSMVACVDETVQE